MPKYKYSNKDNNPFVIQSGQFKNGHVISGPKIEWLDNMIAMTDDAKAEISNKITSAKIFKIKFFLFLLFGLLIGRAYWLQVLKASDYKNLSDNNRIRIERLEPQRGIILDSNKRPLVHNVADFVLYLIPNNLPKETEYKDEIFSNLSTIINDQTIITKAKEELSKIKPKSLEVYQPLIIAENLSYEQAMKVYIDSDKLPGVFLTNTNKRKYDLITNSLSHLVGYTGKINAEELKKFKNDNYSQINYIGKSGLEYSWERELRGQAGKKQIEVDALGKEKKVINQEQAKDGSNLVLSLDVDLQKKLEDVLKAQLDKMKLTKASAVLLDPRNGEIKAMISLPAYDNNLFANGISQVDYKKLLDQLDNPLFARAYSGEFACGSTIKLIVALAGLEAGVISEHTTFLSTGGLRLGQWVFPDWKAGGHGITDVRKAIAQSVNTFFYYVGGGYQDFVGLGFERLLSYYNLFGVGEKTGLDLPGEVDGFLPTKKWKEETKGERWYIGDTYHISIGQGDIMTTPLQIAYFTSFFANSGTFYQPHLVKEVLSSTGELIKKIEPKINRENKFNAYNIDVVRQGMRQTITAGSASSLKIVPVEVAGKTGTAQWSSKKKPHAWFTGFAPYKDPEIVLTILVEEGEGGDISAVPVAREFLKWYFEEYKLSKK